ncbi:hypothetical protein [Streptomyces sp. ISL-94]|uniref:hypothetical protein n=1 Tax=Streptomyces sp. ISL-94 TaxID=2819190 RepID=UPI001BEC0442|nr:hypothetical protein [Streptomyces sp. ISL-94]MBT2477625.1 hypothetical protein [Streptomyces sp. ISL-94]
MSAGLLASIAKARVFCLFAGFAWLFGVTPSAPTRVLIFALVAAAFAVDVLLDGHRITPTRHRTPA